LDIEDPLLKARNEGMDFTAKKGTPILQLAMSNNEANNRASGYGNHIN
jgi:hypothetical protein